MATFFGPWNLGKLISDTFNVYFKKWLYYIAIVAPFVVITTLISWSFLTVSRGTEWLPGFYWPSGWDWNSLYRAIGFGLLGAIIAIVIEVLMNNTLIHAVGQHYSTEATSLSKAFSAALKKLITVILASLLRGIILFALCITLIGIPVAIYLVVKWIFVTHVILFEGKGVTESLSRSAEITKDNWWRLVAYVIIVAIIAGIISSICGLIIPAVGTFDLGLMVGSIIAAPITIIATTLMYFTMRVEKEKYNVAQLQADMDGWNTDKKPDYSTVPNAAGYCPHCGAERTEGARFCSKCGKEYEASAAPETAPEPDTGTGDKGPD